MAVTEVTSALGEWSVTLDENTPIELLDKLGYYGHIAITGGRVDPIASGDALLSDARYVGVLRDRNFREGTKELKGAGMAFWLGDEDDKGETLEEPMAFANDTFSATVTELLPSSVLPGTIYAQTGLYSGSHVYVSRRKALDYVCSLYDYEWRVNGDGTVDIGQPDELYVSDPKTAILRNRTGSELTYKALPGRAELQADVKDFTTRVLLLAEGQEATTVTATADILPEKNPYKTLFGDPIKLTRVISEQQTSEGNAQSRAQLQLNRFTSPREAMKLNTSQYDIKGDVGAGDYIWVYDPEAKLIDETNQIDFHGQEIYPLRLRVFQLSWPIAPGMGVAFRTDGGEWIDLTDYVVFESGETDVTVGGYNRSLTGAGSGPTQDPGSRPIENSTVPDVVTWNLPFAQSTYQSEADGFTRAQVVLDWDQPLNTDGSIIQDGFQYEIRYRTGEVAVYLPTHEDLSSWHHDQLLGTFGQPIAYTQSSWTYAQVGWDNLQFLMMDLTPGIPYDFQIRAYDLGSPPNVSEWSDLITIQTRPDTIAPSVPAAVQVVAGSRNAIQVVHTLGKASGGEYNLEADLNHLVVHGAFTEDYLPDNRSIADGGTMLGKLPANIGMIRGEIPAVGTFQLDEQPDIPRWIKVVAVDHFGNESGPSAPMQQTAELIDSAFISDLTVSKVSAGTVTATWVQAGVFKTGDTGARVVWAWYGIEAYNNNNLKTLDVDSTTGDVTLTGTVQSGVTGRRIVMAGGTNSIRFYPETGESRFAQLLSYIPGNYPNDIAVQLESIDSDTTNYSVRLWMLPDAAALTTYPQGNQLANASQVRINVDDAYLSSHTYNGTVDQMRAQIHVKNTQDVWIETFHTLGEQMSRVSLHATDIWETLNSANGDLLAVQRINTERMYFEIWNPTNDNACGGALYLDRDNFGSTPQAMMNFRDAAGTEKSYIAMRNGGIAAGGDSFSMFTANGSLIQFTNGNIILSGGPGRNSSFRIEANGSVGIYENGSGYSSLANIKAFVIDHPTDPTRYLMHGCTESPHAGVEYWGEALTFNGSAIVDLPDYFEALTSQDDRQVQLTVQGRVFAHVAASDIEDGSFTIWTDVEDKPVRVAWLVKAVRTGVVPTPNEPKKTDYARRGNGPYTWLEKL